MKRVGTAEEIASMVGYLTTREAGFINGEVKIQWDWWKDRTFFNDSAVPIVRKPLSIKEAYTPQAASLLIDHSGEDFEQFGYPYGIPDDDVF